ncbi:hypothetical protein OCE25_26975 [Bacillus cereus]|nr:hypothetical protein [Bacillus cereus]
MIKPEELQIKRTEYQISDNKQVTTINDLKHINLKNSEKFSMLKMLSHSIQPNKY